MALRFDRLREWFANANYPRKSLLKRRTSSEEYLRFFLPGEGWAVLPPNRERLKSVL